jgi:hypothetical protein
MEVYMRLIGLLLSLSVFVIAQAAFAEPTHVVIDPSEQSATTFVSLPRTLPPEMFQEIKDNLKPEKGAYLVTWGDFKRNPQKHVQPCIRRNDYPEVDVAGGLALLLERYEGLPFGLTWNGGLALTRNDYQHASQTYATFLKDPRSVARAKDIRADPVHPANHLGPLLTK